MALSVSGATGLLLRTPTALFPIALGLAGLGGAWTTAAGVHGLEWPAALGGYALAAAAVVLAADVLLYGVKMIRARDEVAADLSMATRANLFAPGFVALMVLAANLPPASSLKQPLWMAAVLGHLVLLLRFVGKWLTRSYAPQELNPTWFLPAAGIMAAGMTYPGYGSQALAAFTSSAGAMLWVMLMPLIFRRLVFEPAIDPQLRPTLFIVSAPFGLAAGALLTLVPEVPPPVPAALLSAGTFFIVVLLSQPRFLAAAGVTLSWWATTFPVSVLAAGFLRLGSDGDEWAAMAGTGLLVLASLTTGLAVAATVKAAAHTCLKTAAATERDIACMQGHAPP